VIYVGIDDTDVVGSPGTKRLARELVYDLFPDYAARVAVRHQLLFDPRVPYTSKNSSVSLLVEPAADGSAAALAARVRRWLAARFVAGSDPGLCVATHVPEQITTFGCRCQQEVVTPEDARRLAAEHCIQLEPLGGTGDGVIGALAAVGLLAQGNDGRVVQIGQWPDDLSGPQNVALLRARGVDAVCRADSGQRIERGMVDVGKHLRPNYRDHRVVLFVAPAVGSADAAEWCAVRFT
jgi:hypothetical protein